MDNLYKRSLREQWDASLMGAPFWEGVTQDTQELVGSEEQALTGQLPHQSPTQLPSKNPVQTAVTSSPENSPKKKSHFQLSQLASFNSLRLRNTIHSSPAGTDTTTSPEKSPTKSEKSSKKGSLRLPRLPSFKNLSLKRRGPILASTEGIVELQKPTRPSILSPSTFLPPESPLPPIPNTPRPAFRSLYRGPSAANLDIAPPNPSEGFHPFLTISPSRPRIISFQEWLERESNPHPETVTTPHPARSSRISLMAHLNDGGTWDTIPRTRSVLELNMFFDARKVSPKSLVDLDDDQSVDQGAMVDKATMTDPGIDFSNITPTAMVDKVTMTGFDTETAATDKATMAELDIGGSATDNLPADKGTAETDVSTECGTNELTTGDHLATEATEDRGAHYSVKKSSEEIRISILTLEQVRPLLEFCNLRVLKLVGMMKSYQPIIWQTVWLNPQLTTLELEMAVGLDINKPVGPSGWAPIKKGWVMNVKSRAAPVYYGQGGGEISRKIGYGEYLDKYCIEKGKMLALCTGFPVPPSLPVKHLTLTGFAVDGDPFGMWFWNLEEVHFKKDCIDCGFWLSRAQRDVRVRHSDEFGVARGEDGPSVAGSTEELGEEVLADLTAAVGGLGASRM
ncbi:hypothetical protein PEX2_022640 [Penicillium expansum]|uniref:Uncharacterized protein n=1 Tax=Penicillium expansum TaxID=27334 RepID=A0A0A2JG31_PENEN|nr:hypothetical protein PEX2_022640 [Penicillium expansum]KGO48256.1 hypothetical protein PEXP_040760 [Penicillium expansum]KGO53736.1 hypothetical protein PEX2_022640 [Penicillium expansum]